MIKRIFFLGSSLFFLLLFSIFAKPAAADPYDCLHYGTKQCIALKVSAICSSGKPLVTLTWNNPHNDSSFNIVYSHGGHWYMKPILSKVLSTTIPPYGKYQDGGTGSDPGFPATGGSFGAKITGGVPGNLGGSGITTGYSTPSITTTMPNCTITPTSNPTSGITPTSPPNVTPTSPPLPPTKGALTIQVEGIGLSENPNPLHPNRQIVLYFYPTTDTGFSHSPQVFTGNVSFNQVNGFFSNASFPLTGLTAGQYLVLARTQQGSLVSQVGTGDGTGPITIVNTGGANLLVDTQDASDTNAATIVPILHMGDFIRGCGNPSSCDFNYVYTLDWSALVDCFGDKRPSVACVAHGTFPNTQDSLADINDDGIVDGVDYTILMKNFGHFGVGQQTMNRGNPPQ